MKHNNFMTVGELAKILNVSIRTLQYYDKIGLLSPSKISEGGRRLYTSHDMATLHQILTMKSFGFSLDDIKDKVMPIANEGDILTLLHQQEEILSKQISKLQNSINAIKMLYKDISTTNSINWAEYAEMVQLIQENNSKYWVLRYFDKELLEVFKEEYSKHSSDISLDWLEDSCIKAISYQEQGIDPGGEKGQAFAKHWWDMVMKLTGGDLSLIPKLINFQKTSKDWPDSFKILYQKADPFIQASLETYLTNNSNLLKDLEEV